MCTGGGGSVPAANITDPLAKTKSYRRAGKKVRRIKARKGQLDRQTYQQKLSKARKAKRSTSRKYKDKRANRVENDTLFMLDAIRGLLDENNPLNVAQDLLHQSNQGLQNTLTQLNELATMAADNQQLLQEDAMRQSMLRGAPPPEESASAPVIGRNRDGYGRPGETRQALRIDRTASSLTI